MDPVTLTVAAAAMSAVQSVTQGLAANNIGKANAALAEREAQQATDAAAIEEDRHRDNLRRFIGSQTAAGGASGFRSGPAGLLSQEAAIEGERDALAIRYAGSVESARSLSEAAMSKYEGKVALRQGVLGAGAALLKGGAKAYALKKER